jgi:CRISPR-associated endonuclease/helicase Cas3
MLQSESEPSDVGEVDWKTCIAKTWISSDGQILFGRTVFDHCQIVGRVAEAMLDVLWPFGVAKQLFPYNLPLLAALHDIGKVSPLFQKKIALALVGAKLDEGDSILEASYGWHAGASRLAMLLEHIPEAFAWVVGAHHGNMTRDVQCFADNKALGGIQWAKARRDLFVALHEQFHGKAFDAITDEWKIRVGGGLLTVADWIGSGQCFDNPSVPWQPLIDQAVANAGFHKPKIVKGLDFQSVFGFAPRPAQIRLIDSVNGPGIYILEAPMGMGKTEAALYAAYKVLSEEKARGVYFALPTCVTSQKMRTRFDEFLQKIIADDDIWKTQLLVGSRHLEEADLGGDAGPGQEWFSVGKRKILAPFGVGTIDQALFSVMLNRSCLVGLAGLAGKVVILDEVHSYDLYTGTLLQRLVEKLSQLQCTVIILSATLTKSRRIELFGFENKSSIDVSDAYPLISSQPFSKPLTESPVSGVEQSSTSIRLETDETAVLAEAIDRARGGEQVLWIENTVREAQDKYQAFVDCLDGSGIEIGLLHSRFLPRHRREQEDYWVAIYGKEGKPLRQKHGRILVGTQVLEQSLDIDADFLVSRLAPTDMLLQRIGRLWRHKDTVRPDFSSRQACILIPNKPVEDVMASIPQAFSGTFNVYFPYVLLRTLEAFKDHGAQLNMPEDIRPLLETTYQDREETGVFALAKRQMTQGNGRRKGTEQQRQLAMIGAVTEGHIPTRLGDDSIDVLLLKKLFTVGQDSQKKTVMETLDDEQIELPWSTATSRTVIRRLSVRLEKEILQVPKTKGLPPADPGYYSNVFHLDRYLYLGDADDSQSGIRIMLMDKNGKLKKIHSSDAMSRFAYHYGKTEGFIGFQILKGE